ncbi:MAG: ATP-dependent helicase [Syntrophobacteraceae bacterium]
MSIKHLSPPQQEAVRHISSPAIIAAGAGSGKTRTLTAKIAYLVNELGYEPAKILAITFTNKAAAEMKHRLRETTGRPAEDFPWVRTFHSACFKILKEHCELLGYRRPLSIHDDSQQKTHIKKVFQELELDPKLLPAAISMVSHAKNSGDPYHYLRDQGKISGKHEIYRIYNERLEKNNAVDFDDILLLTRDLLRKFPEIRAQYRENFQYILVDEFQDSNGIQNQIVDLLLRNGNLTVVGDDYQSIYKFRGADPAHFIHFNKTYPDAKVFRLEENYRSTEQIVAASDALISCNSQRVEKNCFSRRRGEPLHVKAFPNEDEEAEWVAFKCREYTAYKKIPAEKIAILFRTKFTSLPFERALRFAKLTYSLVGAQSFFKRMEIQDINAYLMSAVNPRDDVSFERIVNTPKRGIGPAALKKVVACGEKGASLREACREAIRGNVLQKKVRTGLEELLIFIESLKDARPDAAIQRVLDETGYGQYVADIEDKEGSEGGRMENIKELVFYASNKDSIADYLEDAQLIREDQDSSDKSAGVKLSTIHAAKGLEFKVVFVVAVEDGILPHFRSIREEDDGGIQEERRLMYVAMTRATDHLHITWSKSRRGESAWMSRFLDEIPTRFMV